MAPAPPELVELARDWLAAGHARDVDFIARTSYSEDESAIHTIASPPDANLTLTDFIEHLRDAPPREVVASDPSGFAHGDVAWLIDFPKVDMLHEGILDGRFTIVFVRVGGEWKVAHAHLSEGVPHEL